MALHELISTIVGGGPTHGLASRQGRILFSYLENHDVGDDELADTLSSISFDSGHLELLIGRHDLGPLSAAQLALIWRSRGGDVDETFRIADRVTSLSPRGAVAIVASHWWSFADGGLADLAAALDTIDTGGVARCAISLLRDLPAGGASGGNRWASGCLRAASELR